jgi:hypothetical protein
LLVLLAFALVPALRAPCLAQDDEREPGWYDQAELSFVLTGGNAEASTLALKNTLERLWATSRLGFHAGALRAESTVSTRFAVGTPDAYEVVEDERTDLTAENYFARLRYDHLPALTAVPLRDAGGEPTGALVLAELDELDTLFTVSLVVAF